MSIIAVNQIKFQGKWKCFLVKAKIMSEWEVA